MKFLIEKFVKKRLGPFEQLINNVDQNQPMKLTGRKNVAIIGGGLAGASAAVILAERGFKVDLFERENFLGGKIGSWKVKYGDGFETNVEHGFHAFFRQYYNLRRILGKVNALKNLIPIADYRILTQAHGNFSFKGIETMPILNLLSIRKAGVYRMRDMIGKLKLDKMMSLLQYDREYTFEEYDGTTFKDYADAAKLPPSLRLMFTTFSRAFFAEPQYISMAELIKSFHFYFLSNDHGLIYDVLDDDFENSLWQPVTAYLGGFGSKIHLKTPVKKLHREANSWIVNGQKFDYAVLATDIPGTQKLINESQIFSKDYPSFAEQISRQKISQKYAVLRLWTDHDLPADLPFFIFTDALKILDSITIYHRMEETSRQWVEKNGGGIYELHSYALPDGIDDHDEIRHLFLQEFETYFPEMKNTRILYENLQVREDFTAFHTNLFKNRAEHKTGIEGLYLAGDWVKLPVPAMLMEAAATSAIYSVNEILKSEGLQQEPIYSVPLKGIFS